MIDVLLPETDPVIIKLSKWMTDGVRHREAQAFKKGEIDDGWSDPVECRIVEDRGIMRFEFRRPVREPGTS